MKKLRFFFAKIFLTKRERSLMYCSFSLTVDGYIRSLSDKSYTDKYGNLRYDWQDLNEMASIFVTDLDD